MRRWIRRGIGMGAGIVAILLLGSVFAPTLCRSRETANRVKCATNLRQIGTAIELYARDHGGELPTFASLVTGEDLVPEVFTCPSSNAERARSSEELATHPTKENLSYLYVGDRLSSSQLNERTILFVDELSNHDEDGVNVLFGDGHVDFIMLNRKTPPAWWTHFQNDLKADVRPVLFRTK